MLPLLPQKRKKEKKKKEKRKKKGRGSYKRGLQTGQPQKSMWDLILLILYIVPEVGAFQPAANYQQHYKTVVPLGDVSYQKVIQRIHNIKPAPAARPLLLQSFRMPGRSRDSTRKDYCSLEINGPQVGSQKAQIMHAYANRVHVFTFHRDQCQMLFVDEENRPLITLILQVGLAEGYTGTSVQMHAYAMNNQCTTHYVCMFIIYSIATALRNGQPILSGGDDPLELGLGQSCRLYRKRAVCLPES